MKWLATLALTACVGGVCARWLRRPVDALPVWALLVVCAGIVGVWSLDPRPRATVEDEFGQGPKVLLITVDTLRADHVGAYGHVRAETPNIDRLAEEGVLFENALAPSPITCPSHTTILTGLDPMGHGAVQNPPPRSVSPGRLVLDLRGRLQPGCVRTRER